MKTIIRIEHKSGYGIFRATDRLGNEIIHTKKHENKFKHLVRRHYDFPTPFRDSKIDRYIEPEEFCAFKSIEQVQQWITKDEIIALTKLDFKVLMLDVSECIEGEYQIIYEKKNILQSKDITNLFI